jgi:hypothetical protein
MDSALVNYEQARGSDALDELYKGRSARRSAAKYVITYPE